MKSGDLAGASLRFGTWGPGYVIDGQDGNAAYGVIRLRPGDEFPNHYHAAHEETFVVLSGSSTLWLDCRERVPMRPGGVYRCDPGEMHYLRNDGTEELTALFVKAPWVQGDKVDVPWRPGDPPPS